MGKISTREGQMKKKRNLKKKLQDFVKDETGSISRESILKIGLGTISALGILGAFSSNSVAGHGNLVSHANTIGKSPAAGGCVEITHSSHAQHNSHGSY